MYVPSSSPLVINVWAEQQLRGLADGCIGVLAPFPVLNTRDWEARPFAGMEPRGFRFRSLLCCLTTFPALRSFWPGTQDPPDSCLPSAHRPPNPALHWHPKFASCTMESRTSKRIFFVLGSKYVDVGPLMTSVNFFFVFVFKFLVGFAHFLLLSRYCSNDFPGLSCWLIWVMLRVFRCNVLDLSWAVSTLNFVLWIAFIWEIPFFPSREESFTLTGATNSVIRISVSHTSYSVLDY